jgi:hypothetical protein
MKRKGLLLVALVASAVAAAGGAAEIDRATATTAGPETAPSTRLTTYGRTVWNLEALLHRTFGTKTICLRWHDYAFVAGANCGDLANYGYWKDIFVGAHGSKFRLMARRHPPVGGNVVDVKINGRYVFCGRFPVAFAPLAHLGSHTRRWLVVLHGWAMTPFTCLGS